MAKLYDLIQGLIDTDKGIISKLKSRITDINQDIEELKNLIQELIDTDKGIISKLESHITDTKQDVEELKRGSSTSALIDKDTPDISGSGELIPNGLASKGSCYHYLTTNNKETICHGVFSDVNYGHYSLCVRIRVDNNSSSSPILTFNILNKESYLLTKEVKGINFDSNSQYCYLCTTFEYNGSSEEKSSLHFELKTTGVSNINVYFDYAYITLITPAVYV